MQSGLAHTGARGFKLTTQDNMVIMAGALAVTHDWWAELAAWLPPAVQILITTATVIFVVFRAVNEIRRYWRERGRN